MPLQAETGNGAGPSGAAAIDVLICDDNEPLLALLRSVIGLRPSLKKGAIVMPVDQRDAAVRAYLDDVFKGHNLKSLDKYMKEDLVSHWLGDRSLHGIEAWRAAWATSSTPFLTPPTP